MRGTRHLLIGLVLAAIGLDSHSQVTKLDQLTPNQLEKYAKNRERTGDIFTAIYFYEKFRMLKPNDSRINYQLAELHRQTRNYVSARDLYMKVIKQDNEKYPMAQFYYAQMLKATGEYEEAIDQFEKFKKGNKAAVDDKEISKMVNNEIHGCDSALIIIKKPLKVNIKNLNSSINSPHIELSPIILDDNNFIYSSLRIDSMVYFTNKNVDTAMPSRQFYMGKKVGMDWIGQGRMPGPINIPGVETGNGVFSRDGKRFYFTRSVKNWQGKIISSIYRCFYENGQWGVPMKLPPIVNDPNYTSTQPTLGRTAKSDQEIIYFVSDRSDGKGGLDVWYTVWNEEKDIYSVPKNAGSRINTIGDEMTPYFHTTTRTLYFSSTGLPGMGGYDIFSSFGERQKWSIATNVGYPMNSSYDDLYFTTSRVGGDGFFVSNRPVSANSTTCCDDIYYYSWNDYVRITVTATIYPFEKDRFGRKRDLSNFNFMKPGKDVKPFADAKIALYMFDKESKEYVFMDRFTTEKNGRFYFTLQPDKEYEFRMDGFQYFDEKNYLSTQDFNFSDTIVLPPIWVNVLSDKPILLENVYYDFNSADLSQRAKTVLDTTLLLLLKEAPQFIIEIGSHTDSIGDTKYNLELSQERANNVVDYLILKGIPTERLVAKGYGAESPVAPNFNPDGSDNPEGREKNRRTEFRIVGTLGGGEEEEEFIYK